MPYVNKRRPYKKEYDEYQGTEKQKKNRAKRNAARRKKMREGKVKKGDGKDVDHKTPLSKGGSNAPSNLRVKTAKKNRSFKRNSDRSVK
jgi:5-methylcytosine-specific restriction endonuclease McrA